MIKSQELADKTSCINKAADDEPVFVLRASDITAPDVIEFWVTNAVLKGARLTQDKLDHAVAMVIAMREWPLRHLPD